MKVYKTNAKLSVEKLHRLLLQELNPLFQDKIQKDIRLDIIADGDSITIGQHELYESFLYKLTIAPGEVQLTKSEDYVDDVYNLALDDLVNGLIAQYIGANNIETITGT